jgi:hypothetical protein
VPGDENTLSYYKGKYSIEIGTDKGMLNTMMKEKG